MVYNEAQRICPSRREQNREDAARRGESTRERVSPLGSHDLWPICARASRHNDKVPIRN